MAKAKKFGAISGVFVPSILTILGVIMYLRLPWIVGQAGLWATVGIILVAHIISFSTGLSVASIATDKKVETGGSYYIISRSLGLPIGGTLGLALFVGLSFSISLYLIGFAEVSLGYFGFETTLNNIRIAGALALLGITILTFISTSLAIKSQYIILTILALSLVSVFFGRHEFDPGQPLLAPMDGALPWIALFAIFFPAVTGFEAGVSMSGDLRDPRKNIPTGTIAAVLVGLIVYIGLTFFLSYTVDRNILVNDPSVLFQIAWIPQLVVVGIMAATLSSALGSILGAPRILQATAIDRITPSILGKGFGASNEPRNALLFTFIIAMSGILIGELNVIARIVTIFFIITYGFLNITYAVESWAGTDFRPTFKIPWVISIIGAIACIVVMIQLDIVAMIGASLVLAGLFLFLKRRELTLQTGDTWNSVWASVVKTGLGRLTDKAQEPRNWRPNVILFSGGPKNRPHLIELGKSLVGKLGIFTSFELIESKDEKTLFSKNQQVTQHEVNGKKGVFTRRHICRDIYEGMESIAKVYGFSGFEPNTILMGWSKNSRNPEAFTRLVKSFKRLDYNIVFLNYDKEAGFGQRKNIDIWWNGQGRNLSYALALLRFVTSSHEWRTARIRILAINNHSELTDKYYELIQQTLDNNRINADIKVINNSVEQLPEADIMRAESVQSDLTIFELGEDQENFSQRVNLIAANLKSSMIIRSSSGFEELNVVKKLPEGRIKEPQVTTEPGFSVVGNLNLATKEIIANEVYNISQNLESLTHKYYKDGYGQILSKTTQFQKELIPLFEKTCEYIYQASKIDDDAEMKREFLKILNDFSFKAQKTLKILNQDVILFEKQCLAATNKAYFESLDKYLMELPQYIRIKYNWKEFRLLRADSFITGLFKLWKIFKSRITGRPAVYKIKTGRKARYYLYHKRLNVTQSLLNEFFVNSFSNIVEIRKLLSDLYEIIEKGKSGSKDREKLKNIISMETDRFKAAIVLLDENNRNFYHGLGKKLEEELLEDLQSFSNLLDRPGSNFLSKAFRKVLNKDETNLDFINEFPDIWYKNVNLFVNKIYLDYMLQTLKNRIEAKIIKYNIDFKTQLSSSLLIPLAELQKSIDKYNKSGTFDKKPDRSMFKKFNVDDHFNKLFEEITQLFADLPVVMSISGEDLSRNLENNRFEEAQEVVVSIRKIVEFSIASDLIDHIKKQATDTSLSLERSVANIQDLIRLINFNLVYESDEEQQDALGKEILINDFFEKIRQEETKIKNLTIDMSNYIQVGLKNAFAPLTAGAIAKTSGVVEKRIRARESQKLVNWFEIQKKNISQYLQNQFVNLVYTKSEGILWVGRFEKPTLQAGISNEKVYEFLENYSPKPDIMKKLPFYYAKLFSGQSGIGEDFWVGMDNEIARADTIIKRHIAGQQGFLLISGERNSGKTSLSRYVARKNFRPGDIHNIRAPKECSADLESFDQKLLKSLKSDKTTLDNALDELQTPCTFIINDLELWWERREHGTRVVERLLQLVKKYSRKVLFIVNINVHSLQVVHKLTGFESWALGTIWCEGFDARQLRDIIMLRHQAGGMHFIMDRKHESELTAWEHARLFNRFFDLTKGNIGACINLWLGSVKKVSGPTLHMKKPPVAETSFLSHLTRDQIFLLMQFVYHLRLSVERLSQSTHQEQELIEKQVMSLLQAGVLIEKFPGIFVINTTLYLFIVDKLKEMKLI
jgi:amino acid transporter